MKWTTREKGQGDWAVRGSGGGPDQDLGRSAWLTRLMAAAGTDLDPVGFVREVNRVHHDVAADEYENRHRNIHREDERVWRRLLRSAASVLGSRTPLQVLDFGAGTGFAAEQTLRFFGTERVAGVTIVEPSAAMRAKACQKLQAYGVQYASFPALDSLPKGQTGFNLVCENSVLHHVPDPWVCLRRLADLVCVSGVMVLAQEPNRRFGQSPLGALNRLGRKALHAGMRPAPAGMVSAERTQVLHALLEQGIIRREIPAADLGMLIDFWVPRPWHAERRGEALGFDKDEIVRALAGFALHAHVSYQHLGKPIPALNRVLRLLDKTLRAVFPAAGEELGLVLVRTARASPAPS